jgi:hypothetical protein
LPSDKVEEQYREGAIKNSNGSKDTKHSAYRSSTTVADSVPESLPDIQVLWRKRGVGTSYCARNVARPRMATLTTKSRLPAVRTFTNSLACT